MNTWVQHSKKKLVVGECMNDYNYHEFYNKGKALLNENVGMCAIRNYDSIVV